MKTTIELAREAGIDFQEHVGIRGIRTVTTCGSQPVERIERFAALLRAEWEAAQPRQERVPLTRQQIYVLYKDVNREVAKLEAEDRYTFAGWFPIAVKLVKAHHNIRSKE